MKTLGIIVVCCVVVLSLNGCLVTKKVYTRLLNEKIALENKKLALEKELETIKSEKNNTISEQKNKIAALKQEIEDLIAKYHQDLKLEQEKHLGLKKNLDLLIEKSSEETQSLLLHNSELMEKYDKDIGEKNKAIDILKQNQRKKIEALNNHMDQLTNANKKRIEDLEKEIAQLENKNTRQIKSLKDLATQADELELKLEQEIKNGEITLKRYKSKTIINIDNSICFDSGSAVLKKNVQSSLIKIASTLIDYPDNNIQIEGHTDDLPIQTSQYPSNWELSSARALSVLRLFLDKTELDPRQLSSVGYGQYHPIVPNDTPDNRFLNRRVDIVILPK